MWYQQWFDQDAYELVYQERDDREAEALITLLERVVTPQTGAAILDVGCGRGRHARVLARRGYHMTGLDLSRRALERARERTAAEGLDVCFRRGDMRRPLCRACFDGIINVFTAFGYFEDDADHLRALRAMTTQLKPGGWLFQDFLNAPRVARMFVPEDVQTRQGIRIVQRRWIADGRINKQITLHDDGSEQVFTESVRLLTLDDFRGLYRRAGLTLVQVFGDYQGAPYSPTSPRLIMYARKNRRPA